MASYQFFADPTVGRYRKGDFLFIASVILLLGLGIFTLFFCSQNYAERIFKNPFHFVFRQLVCVAIGLVGFMLFACLRIQVIRKMLPALFGMTLVFCLLAFVPGIAVEKNGAARWINMPFKFTLQPSEFVKFTLVILLANFFDKQAAIVNPEERSVFPCVVTMLFFLGLVLLQQDLSTPLFIFCVCFAMFLVAGLKIGWVFAAIGVAVPMLFLFIASDQYRIGRIIGFLRPEDGIHTFNYQSIAAKRAISAGGFWGSGIGTGLVQSNRIPEVQADYIFAGWSEAMGLGGVCLYFVILGVFAWRGYRTAFFCQNRFAAYSAFGFVTMIVGQSLVNCGVVCGALPSTGIPLPFFSAGGSSIIITMCMCGIIVNASRCDCDYEGEGGREEGLAALVQD